MNEEIQLLDKNEIVTMTSLELVDLINKFREEEGNGTLKRHDVLLRDIRNELKTLEQFGITNAHNFVEVVYIDAKKEQRPCYKMNKAGIMQMLNKESALVRYKTQQYIEGLENRLKQPSKILSPMQLLKLQYKALEEQDQKIEEVKEDLKDFKEDLPLFTVECEEISKAVKRIGTKMLGGYGSEVYKNKSVRTKVYSDIYKQLKREFGVNSYKAIKRKYLNEALDIVEKYNLTIALKEQIDMLRSQITFN